MKILAGESELKKSTKYGYVTVEIDGKEYFLTPEEVKMILFEEELKNKGWAVEDIQKFKELCMDNAERAERDSNID